MEEQKNTIEVEWRDLLAANPEVESLTAMFADINGVLRGKSVPVSKWQTLCRQGVYFPASVFGTDATGESVAETGLVWESGDADFACFPVAGSGHIIPGSDGREAGLLLQMQQQDGTPHPLDPRSVLGRVTEKLAENGLHAVVAAELEFYLICSELDAAGMGRRAIVPAIGMEQPTNQIYGVDALDEFRPLISAIQQASLDSGMAADTAIAEYGRSQFEINLGHRADPLRAADEAALLRRLVRRIARQHGHDASFMGKPFADDTGSGLHLHISLWDAAGKNIMQESEGEKPESAAALQHAVAGMACHLGESMALFAPNANAWRRLQPGHYAPVDKSWGHNNRTVSFRIPTGPASARRLEHRCASADANVYLVSAAVLAAMADGIERQLVPPPITTGNAYAAPLRDGLPKTWAEALDSFAASRFLRDWLGDSFVSTYHATKSYERNCFAAAVSPLEWQWYR